jgi:hypothetical protein
MVALPTAHRNTAQAGGAALSDTGTIDSLPIVFGAFVGERRAGWGGPSPGAMMSETWQITGCSVRGASHYTSGLPNQDAMTWRTGERPILAVADGHGSIRHFRSQKGSRLAVEAMASTLESFPATLTDPADPAAVEHVAHAHFRVHLVETWRQMVAEHLAKKPVTEAEWQQLEAAAGPAARFFQQHSPETAYGSTALGVLVTEAFLLFVQLGDGDILCVDAQGVTSRPFERDRRFALNQTTSLCLEAAAEETRVCIWPTPSPALILIATDGYANSYRTEAAFESIGSEYLQFLRAQGIDPLRAELPAVLEDLTRRGSGDDITVGVLYRPSA